MFTFLGTGAAEGYPSLWCSCPNCSAARKLGGINLRTNSCAIIGDHTLLDLSPSGPEQLARQGRTLAGVETLLVTHAHGDHFYGRHLRWRMYAQGEVGPLLTEPLPLTVYGSERIKELAFQAVKGDPAGHYLELQVLKPWEPVQTKYLTLTPVLANHDAKQDCYNFVIEYQGKTIFYAVDSAWFLPETLEFLLQFKFDLVVMEGTFGFLDDHKLSVTGHSSFHTNRRAREWMLTENLISEGTIFAITHIGHQAPPHTQCAPRLQEWGLTLAYDGLTIPLT